MPPAPRTLETARLTLRCPDAGDGAAINEGIRESFPALSIWMEWAQGEPPPPEDTAERMSNKDAGFDDRSDFTYMAVERETGRFVGMFSLFQFDGSVPKGAIGYWVRTSATGRGFATEATLALARLGLETLNLARVEIRCDALNARSRAVAERAGFALDDLLKNDCRNPHGALRDTCIYSRIS